VTGFAGSAGSVHEILAEDPTQVTLTAVGAEGTAEVMKVVGVPQGAVIAVASWY
jgi:hypothetical protein